MSACARSAAFASLSTNPARRVIETKSLSTTAGVSTVAGLSSPKAAVMSSLVLVTRMTTRTWPEPSTRPRTGGTASTRRTASAIQSMHIIPVIGSLIAGDSARRAISARLYTA